MHKIIYHRDTRGVTKNLKKIKDLACGAEKNLLQTRSFIRFRGKYFLNYVLRKI